MNKKVNLSSYWNLNNIEWLIILGCQLIFIGFVCSRALVSIGMIGILCVSILFFGAGALKKYVAKKELLILSLFFWIVFFSGVYSSDKQDWLNWVRIKLPYIALPLAFAPLRRLDNHKFKWAIYGYVLTFFICTVVILTNYFLHYAIINQSFFRGGTIPMPFSHIRYALMLTLSFFCALYLLFNKKYNLSVIPKWLLTGYALFAFIALHLLAVRSGLFALYLGLLFFAIYQIFAQRKFMVGFGLVLMVVFLPVVVYQWVPSIHNKARYMLYDIGQYREGNINQNSDAMRLLSMQVGLKIWQAHQLIGVGAGGLKEATDTIYQKEHPEIPIPDRRQPHNQFIWVMAGTGMVGLALFLIAFLYPLFVREYYKNWLMAVFYIIIGSSFFTEVTLEEQMGTGFYTIFLMLFMNHFLPE